MNFIKISGVLMMLAAVAGARLASPVSAHQDQPTCNADTLEQLPEVTPLTAVNDGNQLSYSVTYSNLDSDDIGPVEPCNVTDADATLTLPNGSVVNILTGATINAGESIVCPGGPGCAVGPYTYTVAQADVVDDNVTANFNIDGVSHLLDDSDIASDSDSLTNQVISPSTAVGITASLAEVEAGGTVALTVTETNDGEVAFTDTNVQVDNGIGLLDETSTNFSGDANLNGALDPGETWQWSAETIVNTDTTFMVTGHGKFNGLDYTWCADPTNPATGVVCDQEEQASVSVSVAVSAETACAYGLGYWKNHTSAWPVTRLTLGTIDYSQAELLNILKQPVKGNGYITMAHQLITAMLNVESGVTADAETAQAIVDANALIGGSVVPPIGSGKIASKLTSSLNGELASFNEGSVGHGQCSE